MLKRDEATKVVVDGLKRIYRKKLQPLEKLYMFDFFYGPMITDLEFDSKPQVLLLGPCSTGKTSFIRYLLGRDFPGQRIGPEPTTEKFVVVMDGKEEHIIPGNALAVAPDLPYQGLEQFGTTFLDKFEGSQLPSKALRGMTLIDTPGIMSGEKLPLSRGYDFVEVSSWFAERADLILLLFDANNLDISDEYRAVIEKVKGQEDKIRCVLNKADTLDQQKLMHVYGSLLWNMGSMIRTIDEQRVYIGSFWNEPSVYSENAALLDMEERDLMKDLRDLPRNSAIRKVSELAKRCKLAIVHAYLIGYLRSQMPVVVGKEKVKKRLMQNLGLVFRTVAKEFNLAPCDFPDLGLFQSKCEGLNFAKFPKMKLKMIQGIYDILSKNIPHLMELLSYTSFRTKSEHEIFAHSNHSHEVHARLSISYEATNRVTLSRPSRDLDSMCTTPPARKKRIPLIWREERLSSTEIDCASLQSSGQTVNLPSDGFLPKLSWALEEEANSNFYEFNQLKPAKGVLPALAAMSQLQKTGISADMLGAIWKLSDIDKDGGLDHEEYTLALHLCNLVKLGKELPDSLPVKLVPVSKRMNTLAM